MIEVEKKFLLSKDDLARLIKSARFIRRQTFHDVYYDTVDYALTTKDTWLRSRNNIFELKVPLIREQYTKRVTDQYRELETEDLIRSELKIPRKKILIEDLREAGYSPFAEITTNRAKYTKEGFIIDIDDIDFGYEIAEIELMVDTQEEIDYATRRIVDFAREHKLKTAPVRGKVVEYLVRKKPDHYKALVKAGVI